MTARLVRAWGAWVALWEERRAPDALAFVRIAVAVVLLADLVTVALYGLVVPLWATHKAGGMGLPTGYAVVPEVVRWLPHEPWVAWALWGTMVAGLVLLGLGVWTGPSAVVVALTYAQTAQILNAADRGIDTLLRNVLWILVLSQCGRAWSLMAKIRTGSWRGDRAPVPDWPRKLLLIQLLVVYAYAGVAKLGSTWTPMGGFSALWVAMRDPAYQVWPSAWVDAAYPATQLLTASTLAWEWSALVVPLVLWWQRRTQRRSTALLVWVIIGAVFHLGTALTLRLGIFPFAMLALYPAWGPTLRVRGVAQRVDRVTTVRRPREKERGG